VKGGSASPKTMPEAIARGADIRRQSRIVVNALRTTRSTLDQRRKMKRERQEFTDREIFPDSRCRLDREFVSADGARHVQLDSSRRATSVFLQDQFRARR
jgi:hypothetical protein